ncbi:hypothetical protein [Microbulbifer epialgicus]|uniref:Uncharacterized protein n=1 Tax=Microbulbifer epialgicus TaxID=393907 RepID=A0ABV4P627_9GAMM
MNLELRKSLPFIFLVSISVSWGFYYGTNTKLNDFGNANHEWLFLTDALFTLPLLCLVSVRNKKQALAKAAAYICIAILVGSFIIPEESKFLWVYLESGRYLVLGALSW